MNRANTDNMSNKSIVSRSSSLFGDSNEVAVENEVEDKND